MDFVKIQRQIALIGHPELSAPRRRIEFFFALLCALAFLLSATAAGADPFSELGVTTPKVRLKAPSFTLNRLGGGTARMPDFAGKVVLLNFWATWCAPCREEMPAMQRLWERYRQQGLVIVAVAADRSDGKQVASFVDQLGLTYPILLDPKGEVRNRYEVVGLPMSYLIGRDGKISGRVIGITKWDSPQAFALVEHLLHQ
ncbi:MAG: TlpA disulfide reductase family protein [Gammaproteobacteria bacterium]|jgi:peroxiredoxin